jgi:hypothetical protein
MPVEELTEQSTKEEVDAYAEQVAKEVEAERAGEEKDDARITSEHADNEHKETPAEEPSGRDDTADKGEETGESEGQDWLDDDLKAEVAAYGIEESELADFASREELERALRFFDKSALEAGRKAMAEGEKEGQSRNEKGQFAKEEKEEPKTDPSGRHEITLDKDEYSEDIVGEFTRMRDHYESVISSLESKVDEALRQFAEQNNLLQEQHFDGLVDSLGHADLFGKTGKETPKQLERREDLFVAAKAQLVGLEQLGRPTELNESLVSRVARMVFAEDLSKKDLKNRTRKISKQSASRQGGGATRASDPREDPRDEFDRLYKEMDG